MIRTENTPLHLVIAEHGAWRVLWAALSALVTVRPTQEGTFDRLSDHLRRDIGLPPRGSPLPEAPVDPLRW